MRRQEKWNTTWIDIRTLRWCAYPSLPMPLSLSLCIFLYVSVSTSLGTRRSVSVSASSVSYHNWRDSSVVMGDNLMIMYHPEPHHSSPNRPTHPHPISITPTLPLPPTAPTIYHFHELSITFSCVPCTRLVNLWIITNVADKEPLLSIDKELNW